MGGCSAPNCSNHSRNGFRMFRFPRNTERRAQWLQMCRRDKWQPILHSLLCEAHFENSQFESSRADGWRKLKPYALPTLFNVPNCLKQVTPKRRILKRCRKLAFSSCLSPPTNKLSELLPGKHYFSHNHLSSYFEWNYGMEAYAQGKFEIHQQTI